MVVVIACGPLAGSCHCLQLLNGVLLFSRGFWAQWKCACQQRQRRHPEKSLRTFRYHGMRHTSLVPNFAIPNFASSLSPPPVRDSSARAVLSKCRESECFSHAVDDVVPPSQPSALSPSVCTRARANPVTVLRWPRQSPHPLCHRYQNGTVVLLATIAGLYVSVLRPGYLWNSTALFDCHTTEHTDSHRVPLCFGGAPAEDEPPHSPASVYSDHPSGAAFKEPRNTAFAGHGPPRTALNGRRNASPNRVRPAAQRTHTPTPQHLGPAQMRAAAREAGTTPVKNGTRLRVPWHTPRSLPRGARKFRNPNNTHTAQPPGGFEEPVPCACLARWLECGKGGGAGRRLKGLPQAVTGGWKGSLKAGQVLAVQNGWWAGGGRQKRLGRNERSLQSGGGGMVQPPPYHHLQPHAPGH